MKLNEITCISDLYYVFGRWFTLGMFILAFITLPITLNIWNTIFSFLMCASIAFVGCAADYNNKFDYPIHYISACISAICSIIWVSFINPFCLSFMLLILISLLDKKRWLLWCELPCFIMVFITILLNI